MVVFKESQIQRFSGGKLFVWDGIDLAPSRAPLIAPGANAITVKFDKLLNEGKYTEPKAHGKYRYSPNAEKELRLISLIAKKRPNTRFNLKLRKLKFAGNAKIFVARQHKENAQLCKILARKRGKQLHKRQINDHLQCLSKWRIKESFNAFQLMKWS